MAELQIVPVAAVEKKVVEAQYVEMKVPLYSYGCEKKIKKALAHIKGIYSVNVNFNEQKVTVWGICNKYDVLDTMRNKRKEAHFWNPEGNLVLIQQKQPQEDEEEEAMIITAAPSSSTSLCQKAKGLIVPHMTLIRAKSLSWKAWKKVFIRSYSF